jgi:hypothetical protein
MALFCADYIVSRPLIPGIPKLEIQEHATKGYYAFQDYAVAFWWQHVQQVVATPPDSDPELFRKVLRSGYRALIDAGELEDIQTFDDSPDGIRLLSSTMKKVPHDLRDWESSHIYEIRTASIREAVELLFDEPDRPGLSLYGPWRYKCLKPWCQNFNNGFEHAKILKIHIDQHELPFTCDIQGCPATIVGFATNTERDNHHTRWHPQEDYLLFPEAKHDVGNNTNYMDTLDEAAKIGDLDSVKALLEKVNRRELDPIFMNAVQYGHLHILQYLAQSGSEWLETAYLLRPLLRQATKRRDLEMVSFLCNQDLVSENGRGYWA